MSGGNSLHVSKVSAVGVVTMVVAGCDDDVCDSDIMTPFCCVD